jgi:beta-barrel assembly-enhancing protease
MKKVIFQFIVMALLFLGLWLALTQVPWRKLPGAEIPERTIQKAGDKLWEILRSANRVISDEVAEDHIRDLFERICRGSGINPDDFRLYIVKSEQVNAFALPGNYIVIHSALIRDCQSPEEFGGVLAHELAHHTHGHVVRKVAREVGLTTLLTLLSGDPGVGAEVLKLLTTKAYDRKMETQADLAAVDYMVKAGIDPLPFAGLLARWADKVNLPQAFYYISTHPEAAARARRITEHAAKYEGAFNALDADKWETIRRIIDNG